MKATIRGRMLLAPLLALVASSAFAAGDTAVRLPLLYDSFLPPAAGQIYADQAFGTKIKRLSDAVNTPNHATTGNLLWIGTEYPTASPFNANNSWLILQHQGYFGLYDGSGTYVRDLPFSVNASTEPRWSRTDPNVLFYVKGNKLMRLDVSAGTSTTIRTFSEYSAIRGRGESDISRDGDHFVFAGDAPGGLANRYVFVYEISTNSKGTVLDTIGHAFNQLYLAPDNSVALGWIASGTTRFNGVELFDRNMNFQRQLTRAIGHMHLTRDTNGANVLIWANSGDPQPIPNCQNGIVKVSLSNAQQTCLLQLDWSLAVHITAGDGDGWAFVETYDPANPPASAPAWKPYTNEIIQVKLDGSEARRLLHHRSRLTANYEYQPRATISRDGTTLVYSSTYNLQGTSGHAYGYTDVYLAAVPGAPPPRISIGDASVLESNSGTVNLDFTVRLSHLSAETVTVQFQTLDGTATAPADYVATGLQTLTFPPFTATRTISVAVIVDTVIEPDETLGVILSNPTNADITGPSGLGTITNDDLPTLSIGDVSVLEGHGSTTAATFKVTLSPSFSQPVTVSFATANGSALAGTDYAATTGTLTLAAGATSGTITVMVLGDTILENDETFSVSLGSPTNATLARTTGVGTIVNDDVGKTACASGCDFARIQDAINASAPGGSVLVRHSYDSFTAGEVFPIQTLVINQAGAITITGETDGGGNLTTTVRTRSGPVDGFKIVSPGSLLRDLRILPGDATRVNRVISAARSPGSCPGVTCHLNGLTIRNVVIDFSATFNAGNGIDLLADNVWIDKVTIKGIAGNSILVDGNNATIQNSTLDGRDPNSAIAIRGALAIGFGADLKNAGTPCSGLPTNYLINSNTIVGYVNGIRWCSGRNNTVSENTLTDISGKGIDTSGSQGTQIFGNVLQNNQAATYGIALSTNAFQACTGNLVRNNKVLGRAARDMQRGIMVENCLNTTIFQNEVRDFADNGGAIYVSMAPGVATKTTIQGNTVIGGNAAGIVYFGADGGATAVDQSVIRDNVVNEFRRNGIVVQGIKGPRSGAGAGNVVAYNTVRATNQGSFGNTHAFNLQNLAGTAFDRNTALDTIGGFGFFLANATGVNGNCNTGATNASGLFGQVNVTPVYGNANVNCRVALYSRYDFDGDGRSDVTMYRHTTGEWFTKSSATGADSVLPFGSAGSDDIPAPGNYTTGAKTDHAIYRYTTGQWFIRRATDGGTSVISFGSPLVGDVPMPADYDGDGLTDIAVFRTSTANAEWYILRSSDGATQYVAWGCAACADLGVPGDYDGDGKADVAVYRRSTGEWFIRKSSDTTLQQVPFGNVTQGDIPVPGRYTQTSKTDMAVYRSLTGEWFIRRSTDFGTTAVAFGVPSAGDFPVAADFTQSGFTDIAIYRPTPPTAAFLIRRSTDFSQLVIPYGNPGLQDAPLTAR